VARTDLETLAVCLVLAATLVIANAATVTLSSALDIDGTAGHTQTNNAVATWTVADDLHI